MSTSPDRLFHMGGAPVSGNPYLGMWGEKTWFVDYDNGTTGGTGKSIADAAKHLQDVIDGASANDVIYVRPRTPNTMNYDPHYIIPESTTNWDIPYTLHGLAIIGTGYGRGQGGQFYTYMRGTGTATATPAFDVDAPWTLMENLSFHDGASTSNVCVALDGLQTGAGDGYACGNTISNCMFRFGGNTSLTIQSVMWATILDCTFHKGAGITVGSSEQVPDGIEIGNCQWLATAAQCSANITIADCDFINIHHNVFANMLPTGGTNVYISVATAATGVIAGNIFGDDSASIGSLVTANGLTTAGNYSIDYAT